jgi:hypothetical protein
VLVGEGLVAAVELLAARDVEHLAGDARKTTAFATSRGVPGRGIGIPSMKRSTFGS